MKQCEKENWSVRELKRQMKSMLFYRLANSKDKKGLLALAQKGAEVEIATDSLKDAYVFDVLGITQKVDYLEG